MKISHIINEEPLNEIKMSTNALGALATNIPCRVGFEFECCVPEVYTRTESRPDYREDEYIVSYDNAASFFHNHSERHVERAVTEFVKHYVEEDFETSWSDADHEELLRSYFEEKDGLEGEELEIEVDANISALNSELGLIYREVREFFRDYRWEAPEVLEEHMMTELAERAGLDWPYMLPGDPDPEEISLMFAKEIGMPVHHSKVAKTGKREIGAYTVEPDSSIEPAGDDVGLEFISPPLDLNTALMHLKKFHRWAGDLGIYTNDSCGLHINVSLQDFDISNLDYIKLAVLVGDDHILKTFGRSWNTYAKPTLSYIDDKSDLSVLLKQLKTAKNIMATELAKSFFYPNTDKYVSIHPKGGYIEFRAPGGDWMSMGLEPVVNTLYRYVVCLDAACDPNKYKNEYLKKLYQLVGNEQRDALDTFVNLTMMDSDPTRKQEMLKRYLKNKHQPNIRRYVVGDGYRSVSISAKDEEDAIYKALRSLGVEDNRKNRAKFTVKLEGA